VIGDAEPGQGGKYEVQVKIKQKENLSAHHLAMKAILSGAMMIQQHWIMKKAPVLV
jgi:hypothetical protein